MKTSELKKVLETIRPGLAAKEIVEQFTSFAFVDNRAVTYNDQISLSHPLPEGLDITGAVSAEEFYKLISKLKGEEVEITIGEAELLLKSGKTRAGLRLQTEITLPLEEVSGKKKWKPLPDTFCEALAFTREATSTNMTLLQLTAIHITAEEAQASDRFRIATFAFSESLPPETDFLLPANAAREIIKLKPHEFALSENGWIHFHTKEDTVLSCRLIEGEFPDITPYLQVEGVELKLPENLLEILDRTAIFSSADQKTDEVLEITLENNRMVVRGENETGWVEESSRLRYTEDPLRFGITPMLFRTILTQSGNCVLDGKKILFSGLDWKYLAILREVK